LQQRHAVVAKILQNLSRLLAKGFHARPRLKSNSAASGSCGSRQMQPTTSPLVIEQCRLPSDKARRASRLVLTIARSHKFCVPTGRLKLAATAKSIECLLHGIQLRWSPIEQT